MSPGLFRVTVLLWQSWPATYVIVVTVALGLSPFWGSECFLFALFQLTSPFLGLYSSTGRFRRGFLKKKPAGIWICTTLIWTLTWRQLSAALS